MDIEKAKRNWRIFLDGQEIFPAMLGAVSQFGRVIYGRLTEKKRSDGWWFWENGGGGAVVLPYAFTPENDLLVGVLLENRPNLGEKPVWCVVGGFVDENETHHQAQVREAGEEIRLDTSQAKLLGRFASNRGFVKADLPAGEGTHAFGVEVLFDQLGEASESGSRLLKGGPKNFRFFPVAKAIELSHDGLALAAIALLLTKVAR